MADCCMGVGVVNPNEWTAFKSLGFSPSSSNVIFLQSFKQTRPSDMLHGRPASDFNAIFYKRGIIVLFL
jgi:hypothetical protein